MIDMEMGLREFLKFAIFFDAEYSHYSVNLCRACKLTGVIDYHFLFF